MGVAAAGAWAGGAAGGALAGKFDEAALLWGLGEAKVELLLFCNWKYGHNMGTQVFVREAGRSIKGKKY